MQMTVTAAGKASLNFLYMNKGWHYKFQITEQERERVQGGSNVAHQDLRQSAIVNELQR